MCKAIHLLASGLALTAALMATGPAAANDKWPSKPVKIIVPTAPGLASDALARLLADHLSKSLGQAFFIENRPGAGGLIAVTAVARAPADGYVLTIASSAITISPAVMTNLPVNPLRELAPIANIALTPQLITASASGPYAKLSDLIAAASRKDLPFGIPPLGSTSHLAYEAFSRSVKVKFNLIPFRGNTDAATQVIAGDVAAMYDTVPGSLPLVRSGKLRPLAVADQKRSPFLPETPTLAELGIKNAEAVGWIGLAAAAKTPTPILDRLNAEVRTFIASPATQQAMKMQGFVPAEDLSRDGFERMIDAEAKRWAKLAKEANIRVE
ncbi:Bug family tripartite tricarboxylate transporter substrate binding protein [Variovorax paradoxus]|uniref:Bug family tripartite tricarboxylate transporter substrate binding protein n=1 Tax=Variovorax paradoxus TaxID=34073 RepID=UPI0029C6EBE1|nr:tripartite tricarboxylate transporter substrate binding protein [Variovorax paradoxus]